MTTTSSSATTWAHLTAIPGAVVLLTSGLGVVWTDTAEAAATRVCENSDDTDFDRSGNRHGGFGWSDQVRHV